MTEREEEERVEKIEKFREASSSRKEVEEFPRERWTSPKLRQRLFKNWLHREISQRLKKKKTTVFRLLNAMGFTLDERRRITKIMEFGIRVSAGSRFLHVFDNEEEYLSSDSLYLKYLLSKHLTHAIREMITRKPSNSVEYLGHWLLNYKVDCSKVPCDSQICQL
ncbi:uncharacterized protein LOC122531226 isoform X1 [Frieseomelitta varia]|nr:uncharacterized protein LOC122531226 isoform X1 [Frieseomelitta varia]